MTNNFCALCADLIEAVLSDDSHIDCTEIARRARAALADEPAVPEVVGSEWQPCVKLPITVHVREQRPGEQHVSTREGITPVQSDDLIMLGVDGEEYPIGRELFQRTYRMGSADEPAVPEGREPVAVTEQPSDEELALIYHDCCRGCEFMDQGGFENAARAVLARWGNLKARVTSSIPADGEVAELVADLQQQANHGFSDLTRNLLISLASHMAYMQGQLQARHDPDEADLEDCYWYAESVALRQMVSDALAGEPAALLPLADTHYEWELEDAKGEWQAGGSSNSQSDVEREGMRYLQTYTQDGPHKLIIRQHTTQTINEITNG